MHRCGSVLSMLSNDRRGVGGEKISPRGKTNSTHLYGAFKLHSVGDKLAQFLVRFRSHSRVRVNKEPANSRELDFALIKNELIHTNNAWR